MKASLILILLSLNLHASDYQWEKEIGHNRIERGLLKDVQLTTLGARKDFQLDLSCLKNEVLITGGCTTYYGFLLNSSFPFTSSSGDGLTRWMCASKSDPETALTSEGHEPNSETKPEDLVGAMSVSIICEKLKDL